MSGVAVTSKATNVINRRPACPYAEDPPSDSLTIRELMKANRSTYETHKFGATTTVMAKATHATATDRHCRSPTMGTNIYTLSTGASQATTDQPETTRAMISTSGLAVKTP